MRVAAAIVGFLVGSGLLLLATWSGSSVAHRFQARPTAEPQSAPVMTLVAGYPFYLKRNAPLRYAELKRDPKERK